MLKELAMTCLAGAAVLPAVMARVRLSRAKHPSLTGHARMSRWLARQMPAYAFEGEQFFGSDGAGPALRRLRQEAFAGLSAGAATRAPRSLAMTEGMESGISDLQFTRAYRVPFQYADHFRGHYQLGGVATATAGVCVTDADGNSSIDLTGSYGVNLFGYDFYKRCIEDGAALVRELGPVLGSYHPVIADNVRRLQAVSGMEEVSFHMSGTEAVMQAVRLARYHTRREKLVRFCGSYHGWWDDVQPGVGTPRRVDAVYTLREMHARTLKVLETRHDIACVLVNPLQSLHPNSAAPGDSSLLAGDRTAGVDRAAYAAWLRQLREVCTRRGIVLIFDEVFVGFRVARGGAQEYFGVQADMVTYGKSLGGGLPVGVVCGSAALMRRFRNDRPADICFARGTFNSHPYVMGAMNAFLRRLDDPDIRATYDALGVWDERAEALNRRLAEGQFPVRVANLVSIWTICYSVPSRYNWMFQFYLRQEGLALSWVGSGRVVFSHNFSDLDFEEVASRVLRAAERMRDGGWWWFPEGATNATVRRQVLLEMLAARVRGRAHRGVSVTTGSNRSPLSASSGER